MDDSSRSDTESLDADGRVKILDFGLARAEKGSASITQSGMSIGTPREAMLRDLDYAALRPHGANPLQSLALSRLGDLRRVLKKPFQDGGIRRPWIEGISIRVWQTLFCCYTQENPTQSLDKHKRACSNAKLHLSNLALVNGSETDGGGIFVVSGAQADLYNVELDRCAVDCLLFNKVAATVGAAWVSAGPAVLLGASSWFLSCRHAMRHASSASLSCWRAPLRNMDASPPGSMISNNTCAFRFGLGVPAGRPIRHYVLASRSRSSI